MIKKVVIAAAGEGTRMLHLTKNKPKHLIHILERPFLAYLLDNLFSAGYREIILVVGYKGEAIEEFVKGYMPSINDGFSIECVNQYKLLGSKEKEYGTACPLKCIKDIKESFIFLCGDNLYSIRDLMAMNVDDSYNYVAGLEHLNPQKYGVLREKGGLLHEVIEKPKEFMGNLINAGLYKFTPEIFEKIAEIKKSSRGEYEITDAISSLAKEGKVKVKRIKDFWKDFGNPSDIIKLSHFIKSRNYNNFTNILT